jgi:hypothetical protein
MDYDPMVMDDAEALGPVVKISQVRPPRHRGCPAVLCCDDCNAI